MTATEQSAIAEITGYLTMIRDRFDADLCPGQRTVRTLMLDHGQPFFMNERTFSEPRGVLGQCFRNAFQLADRSGLTYVEGWCHMGVIPIEHAWCVGQDGYVIDPTLREASGYFGIPFQWDYVRQTALRTRVYGVISITNPGLLDVPVGLFREEIKCAPRSFFH